MTACQITKYTERIKCYLPDSGIAVGTTLRIRSLLDVRQVKFSSMVSSALTPLRTIKNPLKNIH